MGLMKVYRIETERLVLRCYKPSDAQMSLDAITASVDHLRPWMPWALHEPTDLEAKIELMRLFRGKYDLGQDYVLGIFDKEETIQLGGTGLHTRIDGNGREIGYWIHAHHIHKGYATETVKALVKIGFEIEKLDRIEIHCDPRNEQSLKIPEKLGFTLEAVLKNRLLDTEGKPRDKMIWTLFKEQYEQSTIKDMEIRAFDVVGREIVNS